MDAANVWHFILWIHYLALSLWIGGIICLSVVTAPAVHQSMAAKSLAADIIRSGLRKFNRIELVCCLLLIVTTLSAFHFIDKEKFLYEILFGVISMGFFTGIYAFYLTPRLDEIRENTPTLDAVSDENEVKKNFLGLHRMYVRLMSINLAIALSVLYGSVIILKS